MRKAGNKICSTVHCHDLLKDKDFPALGSSVSASLVEFSSHWKGSGLNA